MESTALFFVSSLAFIAAPGPDLIYVLTRGISGGRAIGVFSAIGVSSGILVHTAASAFGLAMILRSFPDLLTAIKISGGAYLIFLGYRAIKNRKKFCIDGSSGNSHRKCFLQGFISNVLNPKVALFFVAYLPQFISSSEGNYQWQLVILGLIFTSMGLIFLTVLGLFSGSIGSWLIRKRNVAGRIQIFSGTVLILLGIRLIIPG